MAGAGTGQPITFRCTRCKDGREYRFGYPGYDAHSGTRIARTGRSKEYRGGSGGARVLDRYHEYHCLDCGHVGWSRHVDIARKPLETAAQADARVRRFAKRAEVVPRPSNYGKGRTVY